MLPRALKMAGWLILLGLTVASVWVGAGVPLVVGIFLLPVAPLVLRARWRWKPTALLLMIPFLASTAVLHALWRYSDGTAELTTVGMADPEALNLDRETRIPFRGLGCTGGVDHFSEYITHSTLTWLTAHFGPMKGAYLGPYPTREEATLEIQTNGLQVDLSDLGGGQLRVGDQVVELGRRLSDEILRVSAYARPSQAVVVGSSLLLLHVKKDPGQVRGSFFGELIADDTLYLVDLGGKRIIARYIVRHPQARD